MSSADTSHLPNCLYTCKLPAPLPRHPLGFQSLLLSAPAHHSMAHPTFLIPPAASSGDVASAALSNTHLAAMPGVGSWLACLQGSAGPAPPQPPATGQTSWLRAHTESHARVFFLPTRVHLRARKSLTWPLPGCALTQRHNSHGFPHEGPETPNGVPYPHPCGRL